MAIAKKEHIKTNMGHWNGLINQADKLSKRIEVVNNSLHDPNNDDWYELVDVIFGLVNTYNNVVNALAPLNIRWACECAEELSEKSIVLQKRLDALFEDPDEEVHDMLRQLEIVCIKESAFNKAIERFMGTF